MPVYYQENGALVDRTPVERSSSAREFMQPLVRQWLDLVKEAEKSKEPFNMVAYQCDSFFSKQSGFMWKEQYRNEYIGPGIQPPKFMVTINKAFELVALFGPYLFWKYPQVFIQTPEPLEFSPEVLGDPNDPSVQQFFQQAVGEIQREQAVSDLRNRMMEKYLNYAQREQPGGGLKTHVEVAITEALVKGRSCLWIEGYNPPGSNRNLTMSRWRSVDDLLIDPDARDPFLEDAKFIILVHDDASSDLERMFQLPKGYMRGRGDYASNGSRSKYSFRAAKDKAGHRDRKIWYEIWSKGGVGNRLTGEDRADQIISPSLLNAFDDVVGDYAYLCVTEGVPFPLNAPSYFFRDSDTNEPLATDDEVRAMFQWRAANYGPPFPCHLDGRWPVALLDFYRTYASSWPIAPLAPALGELTILNILAATFTEQSYENRKRIIAYLESCAKDVKSALNSTDSTVMIALNDLAQKSISDVIQFLDRPEANTDLREAIPFIERLFEQRTGLNEFMYAMQSTQDRTARGVAAKEEKASIRPEKMSQDVAHWLTQRAELEKFLAGWTVKGQDLLPLLGNYGAMFWDRLIAEEDPEVTVREMRCTVEANDHRKPNQQRLLDNMQQSLQFLLPVMQQYAIDTGDTGPLNEFLASMNKAMEDKIMPQLGPWRPEPDEMQMQAQQMQMELEQAKLQADVQKAQAGVQKAQVDAQKAQVEMAATMNTTGIEAQQKQMELGFDAATHQQDLQQSDERHVQELTQDQQRFALDFQQAQAEQALKLQASRLQTADKIAAGRAQAEIKTQAAKQQAKAKPKPTAKAKK